MQHIQNMQTPEKTTTPKGEHADRRRLLNIGMIPIMSYYQLITLIKSEFSAILLVKVQLCETILSYIYQYKQTNTLAMYL